MSHRNQHEIHLESILCSKRLSKIELPYNRVATQNDLMKKKLQTLIEKLKSGQTGMKKLLVMDTSGPQKEDATH